jgi:MoaA/NifB/PqqE/SkfB family radical SAM enzyme
MNGVEYVYLETTNHCNLACSFCNRADVVGKARHMSLEDWGRILDRLGPEPVREAKLMGLGEPFMHPQFDDVCRMFKERFPEAFVLTATNCQYRLHDVFRRSLQWIDMLYLSIDGAHENYERDRPPGKWDKLIRFLDDLRDVDRQGCRIAVNYVVNPRNIGDIDTVRGLVETYGLEELRLNIAQDWSEDREADLGYSPEQIEELLRHSDMIKGRAPWTWSDCFWPRKGLYMDVTGGVKVCCLNTSHPAVGNLFTQDLGEIRGGAEFIAVRDGCRNDAPTAHCATCSYRQLSPLLEKLLPAGVGGPSGAPAYHAKPSN